MKNIVRSSVMLTAVLTVALLSCAGQTPAAGNPAPPAFGNFDLGLTYTYKWAKISNLSDSTFGMQGGAADGVYWLGPKVKNLGVAFDISGESAAHIDSGVGLNQFSLVAGPRYTLWKSKSKGRLKPNIYGQALVGFVHAYNSVFPAGSGIGTSANSVALQTGGGLNLPLKRSFGLRVAEVDYVLTKLANNADTYQGDLRVSTGVTFHF
jgi:outer membrane immunogenic protein